MLNFMKIGQGPITKKTAPPMDVAKNRPASGVDLGAMAKAPRIGMGDLKKRMGGGAAPATPPPAAAVATR